MNASTLWWLLAGALVAVELATGTFYLLMLAAGGVAGAIAAHLGISATGQLVAAAVCGLGAVSGWHIWRRKHADASPATSSPDVSLDIGEVIHVDQWLQDGSARVRYRGAMWSVEAALTPSTPLPLQPGPYRVVQLVGNRLKVEKAA